MSVSTGASWAEAEDVRLPTDGSQAWVGLLLVTASGTISLPALGWMVIQLGRFFIR